MEEKVQQMKAAIPDLDPEQWRLIKVTVATALMPMYAQCTANPVVM